MNKNDELERKALALVRQYKFLLPKPVKEFMRELAEHLGWDQLKGAL
jgi:hypothetical protein